jgi:hypothetical protein
MKYKDIELENVEQIFEFGDGKMLIGCAWLPSGEMALTLAPSEKAIPINKTTVESIEKSDRGEFEPHTTMFIFKNLASFDVVLDRLMIMRLEGRGWSITQKPEGIYSEEPCEEK